jgi:acetamidase/formamidase
VQTIPSRPDDWKFVLGPYHAPAARVQSGETFVVETADAFCNKIQTGDEDLIEVCQPPYTNPVTGPIHVEGAEPGDTLAVKIEKIEYLRDFAVSCIYPKFGGLVGTDMTRTLEDPLPPRIMIHPIREDHVIFSEDLKIAPIPCEPFYGTIGVSPLIAAIGTDAAGTHGGNMDVPDTGVGNTVYFPVCVAGGLLCVGDVHAVQGDGEICGAGTEVPARGTLTVSVIKGEPIGSPRVESDDYLMAIGNARPLEDATRIAFVELLLWIESEFGLDRITAYQLCSAVAKIRVGNMVDPAYSVAAKFPKKYLPQP